MDGILVNICVIINEIPRRRPKYFWKKRVSYLDQFLILYFSIRRNWNFNYRIWLFHSEPFSQDWQNRLKPLKIKIVQLQPDEGDSRYFIRPYVYSYKMDGTHKLVLDCDMIALADPDLDFSVDAQAAYTGYFFDGWRQLCRELGCNYPEQPMKFHSDGRTGYHPHAFIYYHSVDDGGQYFPIFNNGAILVKEEFGQKLGPLWKNYRKKGVKYFKNIGKSGELTIGLAINQLTENWKPFPKGFNFRVSNLGSHYIGRYKGDISLLHYIDGNNSFMIKYLHYSNICSTTPPKKISTPNGNGERNLGEQKRGQSKKGRRTFK